MKIKKPNNAEDYKSLGAHRELNDEFVNSPDRTAGVIAATLLDVRLERLLNAHLIDGKESTKLLSGLSAPLASFSARIRAAYCLGLISKNEFEDLHAVREIRNIFAHHIFDCSFANPEVKAACDSLKHVPSKGVFPTRIKFNVVIGVLDHVLTERAKRAVRAVTPADFRVA